MVPEKFDRLDEHVMSLLEEYEHLKAENRKLLSLLKVKKSEVEWLKERLKSSDNERVLVKSKVDGLILRMEGMVSLP